jgi:hypothetical protein
MLKKDIEYQEESIQIGTLASVKDSVMQEWLIIAK